MKPEEIEKRRKESGEPYTLGEARYTCDRWYEKSERTRNLNIQCDYTTSHLRIALDKLDRARADLVKIAAHSRYGDLSVERMALAAIECIDNPVWPEL